ncbi:hypothetical protein C8A01DRAFT_39347 [Parachaetomium inaequale]|uniref:Uncharacterized protein n=1 Tax=Parachaetomium inaequale TaxID=2588326 RepID=A0AAN6PB50_9PEZI|nr:hypothetical protein C8A01DRAFT_39347 [Parachaetomium inaequale]
MGAYVSSANCAAHYGLTPNCSVVLSEDNSTAISLGGIRVGEFPGDPDIAGAGVLGAFLIVTAVSLLLAIASSGWWASKNVFGVVNRLTREEKALKNWQISIAGIVEALIVTCSDQQVFTGGAYAITLRYAKACSVSAYHYNVVANILLVTCATHLMAVTTARHYWQHPYVGVLRITVTTLVFVITGVLLSNQGSGSLGFPTEVPPHTDQYSPMLLPAACFQTGDFVFDQEVKKALKAGSAKAFFTGQIHGWTNYLIMFLFYLIAVGVSLGRVIRRGMGHNGRRKRFLAWLKQLFPLLFRIKRFFYAIFGLYLLAGIALSGWTVANAAIYIYRLRWWVDKSEWIERTNNRNPENDPSTFGQLVPLLLMSLTVFTFLQIVSERIHARNERAKRLEYAALHHGRRRDSDPRSRSPSPSSRTRYSTLSVVEVGENDNNGPREGEQQLYDDPYNDKLKVEPVVGIRMVEEPAAVDLDIDGHDDRDRHGQHHSLHAHSPAHGQAFGHDTGVDNEQRRWTTGAGDSQSLTDVHHVEGRGLYMAEQRHSAMSLPASYNHPIPATASFIERLPSELVLLIAKQLPVESRIALALTSHIMMGKSGGIGSTGGDLNDRPEGDATPRMLLLELLERDSLLLTRCDYCRTLHSPLWTGNGDARRCGGYKNCLLVWHSLTKMTLPLIRRAMDWKSRGLDAASLLAHVSWTSAETLCDSHYRYLVESRARAVGGAVILKQQVCVVRNAPCSPSGGPMALDLAALGHILGVVMPCSQLDVVLGLRVLEGLKTAKCRAKHKKPLRHSYKCYRDDKRPPLRALNPTLRCLLTHEIPCKSRCSKKTFLGRVDDPDRHALS